MLRVEHVLVRMSSPSDGWVLRQFLLAELGNSLADKIDWTDAAAAGGWLIAEAFGVPVGIVQLLPGKPIGRVECWRIAVELNPREAHAVALALGRVALWSLKQLGATIATAVVDFRHKGLKRMLKRRFGGVVSASGNVISTWIGD